VTQTLKQIREAAGQTQEQAGEALGITKQAYGRKESGKRPLTTEEAVILAGLFGVTDAEITRARRVTKSVTNRRR
jgi:transcriptional regulator with XRE-family HTH domain